MSKQTNIDAFAVETYLDEKGTPENSSNTHIQAMTASAYPDIRCYHEAMQSSDREKFVLAMEQEVKTHSEGKHWEVVSRTSVPDGKRVLPSV